MFIFGAPSTPTEQSMYVLQAQGLLTDDFFDSIDHDVMSSMAGLEDGGLDCTPSPGQVKYPSQRYCCG